MLCHGCHGAPSSLRAGGTSTPGPLLRRNPPNISTRARKAGTNNAGNPGASLAKSAFGVQTEPRFRNFHAQNRRGGTRGGTGPWKPDPRRKKEKKTGKKAFGVGESPAWAWRRGGLRATLAWGRATSGLCRTPQRGAYLRQGEGKAPRRFPPIHFRLATRTRKAIPGKMGIEPAFTGQCSTKKKLGVKPYEEISSRPTIRLPGPAEEGPPRAQGFVQSRDANEWCGAHHTRAISDFPNPLSSAGWARA